MKKKPIPEWLRQKVFQRDKQICRYCGASGGIMHIDHVYPESRGGATILENLVTACEICNTRKGAKIGIWPRQLIALRLPKYLVLFSSLLIIAIVFSFFAGGISDWAMIVISAPLMLLGFTIYAWQYMQGYSIHGN